MKIFVFCLNLFFLFCASSLSAQQDIVRSLQQNVPGEGKVTIHQDPKIKALLGSRATPSSQGGSGQIRTNGYRVQVYAGGNSRAAKEEAESVASQVKAYFPDLAVYKSFVPPRWICRVGDFRSIEEADAMMRRLKRTGVFKEVSIVRDQVTITY
ncbi:MAG: SPOR domain-containing protein [Bacteroides sp.]|nr:SPOR domain-containing protein [Bacteroides sp.]